MSSQRPQKRDPISACFVPSCKNMALMTPNKHFFHIPNGAKSEWCTAVNKRNVPKGSLYICEDHLNLKEDLQNYHAWKTTHVRARLKLRVPHLKNVFGNLKPTTSMAIDEKASCSSSVRQQDKFEDKGIQVNAVMVHRSTCTKIRLVQVVKEELSEESVPSVVGTTSEFSEIESSSVSETKNKLAGRQVMLSLIKRKPFAYIGIPKKFFWLLDYIGKKSIPSLYIVITLYKIKNNDTFSRISDLFEISLTTLWRMYYKTLKVLQSFLKQLIFWPTVIDIKRNLPLSFKTSYEYASVQSIIDCFEIEIEKPKDPIQQSLTWSQYKSCNTIKYLIGATPDGFINFISEGYGGRISDLNLVEQSGFLETIPDSCTILADRGFKHLESLLSKKSAKILRPPSVLKDSKMTKSEVVQSKVIASLRVHIERVIRRVLLYKLLKPHSVVNNKLVSTLDSAVIVACGLINLQSPILKNY